jgi:hypothetical protein
VNEKESSHAKPTEKSVPRSPFPAEFATMGTKRMEDFVNAQTELFDVLQETNREWLDRIQSEATLASEFASKLTAARSIPDAMTTCQDWTSRRFELMAEDSKHLLANTQKFIETGARLWSNGWLIQGSLRT